MLSCTLDLISNHPSIITMIFKSRITSINENNLLNVLGLNGIQIGTKFNSLANYNLSKVNSNDFMVQLFKANYLINSLNFFNKSQMYFSIDSSQHIDKIILKGRRNAFNKIIKQIDSTIFKQSDILSAGDRQRGIVTSSFKSLTYNIIILKNNKTSYLAIS